MTQNTITIPAPLRIEEDPRARRRGDGLPSDAGTPLPAQGEQRYKPGRVGSTLALQLWVVCTPPIHLQELQRTERPKDSHNLP